MGSASQMITYEYDRTPDAFGSSTSHVSYPRYLTISMANSNNNKIPHIFNKIPIKIRSSCYYTIIFHLYYNYYPIISFLKMFFRVYIMLLFEILVKKKQKKNDNYQQVSHKD